MLRGCLLNSSTALASFLLHDNYLSGVSVTVSDAVIPAVVVTVLVCLVMDDFLSLMFDVVELVATLYPDYSLKKAPEIDGDVYVCCFCLTAGSESYHCSKHTDFHDVLIHMRVSPGFMPYASYTPNKNFPFNLFNCLFYLIF